ncbi:MAG: phosphate acyltransferase [Gammaproteobacteria bacterium]|nr:MAG: phosphate acyltransferase [Gammaproteobacteria bacterium]
MDKRLDNKPVIAIDAMGGDAGPETIVSAVRLALKRAPDIHLILVGDQTRIQQALQANKLANHTQITVRHTTEVILSDDSPASVLRNKKDSSMRVAIELVAGGEADACVSAGNTGALMGLARYVLKMLPGIDRPAICTTVPNKFGRIHWLDLGANVDSSAEQLLQFAVMGSALCTVVDGIDRPEVALLNIGSEAIKGNEQVKKAAELIQASPLNYIGFAEGNDIYNGKVDVIACDGFVGNVALKTSEGLAHLIGDLLKENFTRNLLTRLAAIISLPVLRRVTGKIDPGKYNGASLLGLNGIVIKSHGSADAQSFANAIRIAELEVQKQLPSRIRELLANYQQSIEAVVAQKAEAEASQAVEQTATLSPSSGFTNK